MIQMANIVTISSHIIAVAKLIKFITSYLATKPRSDCIECPRENRLGSIIKIVKYATKRKIKGPNTIDILNDFRSLLVRPGFENDHNCWLINGIIVAKPSIAEESHLNSDHFSG